MVKRILKIVAVFIIGTVGGIFADQILWPYFIERPLFYKYRLEQPPVYLTEVKEITIQENTALENVVEKVEKAVVGIKTKTGQKTLEGSGLILTSDGLLVTLAELVPKGANFIFYVDGKMPSYQILKRDLKENLALVKIEERNLPTLGFADFPNLKLGKRVFLVGAVFNKGIVQKITNVGIVKSFNEDNILTNIIENFTLKGSPLFDIEGRILGLNTVNSEGKVSAIPVNKIREFIGF